MKKSNRTVFFIKKLFWWLNLPCLGVVSIYCITTHQNALESLLFNFAFSLCVPYLLIMVEEYRQTTMNSYQDKFSQMSDREVLDMYEQAEDLPMSQQKIMHIKVLERELEKRFGHRKN